MIRLDDSVVDIGLTKNKGRIQFLEGNTMWYRSLTRDGNDDGYCSINLMGRKSSNSVTVSSYPKEPEHKSFQGNLTAFAMSVLLQLMSVHDYSKCSVVDRALGRSTNHQYLVNRDCHMVWVTFDQLTFHDYTGVLNNSYPDTGMFRSFVDGMSYHEFRALVTKEWTKILKAQDAKLTSQFKAMRRASSEEAAMVASVFSFDGDKKQLVQGIQSFREVSESLQVQINFITKAITGIENLEELLFG